MSPSDPPPPQVLAIAVALANAPLRDEMARAGLSPAPDDDAAEMYLGGLERLDSAGFEQYEISNVARPRSRRSRHNLKYWQEGEWLGFGSGAHATFRGEPDPRELAPRP